MVFIVFRFGCDCDYQDTQGQELNLVVKHRRQFDYQRTKNTCVNNQHKDPFLVISARETVCCGIFKQKVMLSFKGHHSMKEYPIQVQNPRS